MEILIKFVILYKSTPCKKTESNLLHRILTSDISLNATKNGKLLDPSMVIAVK